VKIYDFATSIIDKRLPPFHGAGIKREGAQVHFGRGRGMWLLSQTLVAHKLNGKWVISNTPFKEEK